MSDLLTAAEMRAVERAAIASGAVTGAELMERAGQRVVDAVLAHWPGLAATPGCAVVICGPGNNGGDGFVIARLLHGLGWQVAVSLWGDPARLPADARANHARWLKIGPVSRPGDAERFPGLSTEPPALIVDAVLGTGLTRPLDPAVGRLLSDLRPHRDRGKERPAMVAVDVPSGLCADSGRNMGNRCRYDLTVTFHTAKPGHYLADGPELCGALAVGDIGLAQRPPEGAVELVQRPGFLLKGQGHKFDHGHALVLSGGAGRTGAARLAARGALRAGAGLVTLGVPGAAQFEVAAQITALMLLRIEDGAGLEQVLRDGRITALCLGPGLGARGDLVEAALASGRPCVLDADAISLLAEHEHLRAALHGGCVLTPHGGEFARLCPDLAERLRGAPEAGPAFSKVDATRQAAARLGCAVLFKGPDTVIAAPDGRAAVHGAVYDRAAPWLATAGTGDVLAGFIAGFLARRQVPFEAACGAAWLHTEAALAFGSGLIAEDLPDAVPRVLRAL